MYFLDLKNGEGSTGKGSERIKKDIDIGRAC